MIYDYYYHPNLLTIDEVKNLNRVLKENLNPSIIQSPAGGVTKSSIYTGVYVKTVKSELTKIYEFINDVNCNIFNFDIYQLQDNDCINYNVYTEERNSEYGWHNDFPTGNMGDDKKLTVIVNLSENQYTGGNFELFLNYPRHIKELDNPGSILIFPSYMQHRVTPVTKGERVSLSMWYNGPRLK